jgi:hypothetical protein
MILLLPEHAEFDLERETVSLSGAKTPITISSIHGISLDRRESLVRVAMTRTNYGLSRQCCSSKEK